MLGPLIMIKANLQSDSTHVLFNTNQNNTSLLGQNLDTTPVS